MFVQRQPWVRCECCHYADMRPSAKTEWGYSLGCLNPQCLLGQAGRGKTCCSFEREPGADDDIEKYPPLNYQ